MTAFGRHAPSPPPEAAAAAAAAAAGARRSAWARALAALGAGLLLLGAVFAEEAAAAVGVWETSTAYNHCWLVAPVAAWLAWTRRGRLAGLTPAPAPWLALLALPLGLAWLAAERLGIMEGRQLAALALAEAVVLAVLGRRVCRAMAAPLAYLVFLVPFGAFATPALQNATAWMIEAGLGLLGITHHRDGLFIETTAGLFHVAEACAGLRFLIAALAFGALYALVLFRRPGRRLAVMALALVVPVAANGLRALGIVVLGQALGSAEAAAADHVIYGWGFFSAVILLLILAGLPFREDDDVAPPAPTRAVAAPPAAAAPRGAGFAVAAALATALAATGPATAAAIDRGGGGEQPPQAVAPRLAAPAGCESAGDDGSAGTLRCGESLVAQARLFALPPRATWAAVARLQHRLAAGGSDEDATFGLAIPGVAAWRGRHLREPGGAAVALAAWMDGAPAGGGLRDRARRAWDSVAGGGGSPVVAVVALRPEPAAAAGDPARVRAVMRAVLEAQAEGLAAQAAALSRRR